MVPTHEGASSSAAGARLPADRHKTGDDAGAKIISLPKAALATIAKVIQVDGSDLLFTTNGKTPFSGFSKAKRQLDVAMLNKLRAVATERKDKALLVKLNELPKLWEAAAKGDKAARVKLKTALWTLHDLRRTAKTLMARAGVRPDISERVLGHVIEGVEGVYDQHDYVAGKKNRRWRSWQRWCCRLRTRRAAANTAANTEEAIRNRTDFDVF